MSDFFEDVAAEMMNSEQSEALFEYAEAVRSIEAAARAFKEDMSNNGWSEAIAEQIAAATFFGPLVNGSK